LDDCAYFLRGVGAVGVLVEILEKKGQFAILETAEALDRGMS